MTRCCRGGGASWGTNPNPNPNPNQALDQERSRLQPDTRPLRAATQGLRLARRLARLRAVERDLSVI